MNQIQQAGNENANGPRGGVPLHCVFADLIRTSAANTRNPRVYQPERDAEDVKPGTPAGDAAVSIDFGKSGEAPLA